MKRYSVHNRVLLRRLSLLPSSLPGHVRPDRPCAPVWLERLATLPTAYCTSDNSSIDQRPLCMPIVRDTQHRHARTDLTLARLVTPVTGLCLLLLFLTSFVNDRQLGYPFSSIATPRITNMPSLDSASNGHAAGAAVALGALLGQNKRDFLAALKAQQLLNDWIIVMGECQPDSVKLRALYLLSVYVSAARRQRSRR